MHKSFRGQIQLNQVKEIRNIDVVIIVHYIYNSHQVLQIISLTSVKILTF